MKKILFLAGFLCLCFFASSCEDTGIEVPPATLGLSGTGYGSTADGLTLKAILKGDSPVAETVLGQSTVSPGNIFSITVGIPNNSLLTKATNSQVPYVGDVGLSVPLGLVSNPLQLRYYDNSGNIVGYASRNNYYLVPFGQPGCAYMEYFYSAQTIEFTGNYTVVQGSDTTVIDVNYKFYKGWNAVTRIFDEYRTNYNKSRVINADLDYARWEFSPNP